MSSVEHITGHFLSALRSNATYEPPSAREALTLADAYAVQRAFNGLRAASDPVAGFKSAANAEALQRALGLTAPIVGVLFDSGGQNAGAAIRRSDFRTLLIETEIGFRAGTRIAAPLRSADALRAAVTECMPMIELADPGFGRVRVTGTDLIAANAASAGYIGGHPQVPLDVDVNAVDVRLARDGVALHEARGSDLMGDQWQALLWLVNQVVERGYVIEPGHRLMTGALGPAHPATPGHYRAEFSGLGALEFQVV